MDSDVIPQYGKVLKIFVVGLENSSIKIAIILIMLI
jgi:hypothetical protein